MPKFPILKTSIPQFVLIPLHERHLRSLEVIYQEPDIQKRLFRTKTTVSHEKLAKGMTYMYENETTPREITYVLALKSLLKETVFGFMKVKLIDWSVGNCYISIALSSESKYRGKGYAKEAYSVFLPYLHNIGLHKVYGRTNADNVPTIRLNEGTGFRFIGRQSHFVIYPNKTTQDDLFFEHLSSNLGDTYRNIDEEPQRQALEILTHNTVRETDKKVAMPIFSQPFLQEHFESALEHKATVIDTGSESKDCSLAVEAMNESLLVAYINIHKTSRSVASLARHIVSGRSQNATAAGYPLLALIGTEESLAYLISISEKILTGEIKSVSDEAIFCNAVTENNRRYIHNLFLGKELLFGWKEIANIIIATKNNA